MKKYLIGGLLIALLIAVFWGKDLFQLVYTTKAIIALVISLAILVISNNDQDLARKVAWVVIAGLIGYFLLFPTVKQTTSDAYHKISAWTSSDSPVALTSKKVTITLQDDKWSKTIYPSAGVKFYFIGPQSAQVKFLADGTTGSINRWFGTSYKWLHGFQLKGPAGKTVTINFIKT